MYESNIPSNPSICLCLYPLPHNPSNNPSSRPVGLCAGQQTPSLSTTVRVAMVTHRVGDGPVGVQVERLQHGHLTRGAAHLEELQRLGVARKGVGHHVVGSL